MWCDKDTHWSKVVWRNKCLKLSALHWQWWCLCMSDKFLSTMNNRQSLKSIWRLKWSRFWSNLSLSIVVSLIETSPLSPIVLRVWRASQEGHLRMTLHNLNLNQWNNVSDSCKSSSFVIEVKKSHDNATAVRNNLLSSVTKEFHDKEAALRNNLLSSVTKEFYDKETIIWLVK